MKNLFNQSLNKSRFIAGFFVFIFIFALFMTIQPGKSYAQVGCEISIGKVATPDDGTVFTFVPSGTLDDTPFDLISGEGEGIAILGGNTAQVVEEVPDGWVLTDVGCETENVSVSDIENGIEIFCSPNGGAAICTFFNAQQAQVPTLSEWGMIAAAAGLGFVGVFFAVRRRKAQAV